MSGDQRQVLIVRRRKLARRTTDQARLMRGKIHLVEPYGRESLCSLFYLQRFTRLNTSELLCAATRRPCDLDGIYRRRGTDTDMLLQGIIPKTSATIDMPIYRTLFALLCKRHLDFRTNGKAVARDAFERQVIQLLSFCPGFKYNGFS